MVANAWVRSGKAGAPTDFQAFFDELLTIIPRDQNGLLRADAGFYGKKHLRRLEEEKINYVVAAHLKGRCVLGSWSRTLRIPSWTRKTSGSTIAHLPGKPMAGTPPEG